MEMFQSIVGTIAKKVLETTLHAVIFSAVSTKVSQYLKKDEKDDERVRIKPSGIDTDKNI